MPYIKPIYRELFDNALDGFPIPAHKGSFEYLIFRLMLIYMAGKKWNYSNLHDTVYAVQHCADEFRRRFLDEREEEAITLNGDIKI